MTNRRPVHCKEYIRICWRCCHWSRNTDSSPDLRRELENAPGRSRCGARSVTCFPLEGLHEHSHRRSRSLRCACTLDHPFGSFPALAETPAAVKAEIDHLLTFVGNSGCEFYRNGSWYD